MATQEIRQACPRTILPFPRSPIAAAVACGENVSQHGLGKTNGRDLTISLRSFQRKRVVRIGCRMRQGDERSDLPKIILDHTKWKSENPCVWTASAIDVDDITIYYEEYGSKDLRTVLLLHGDMQFLEMWHHQIIDLHKYFHLIVPDTRGQGRTTDSSKPFTYGQFAEDWILFLQQKGIDEIDIVGHSGGGETALALSLKRPDLIRRMVLLGTPYSIENFPHSFWPVLDEYFTNVPPNDPFYEQTHPGQWSTFIAKMKGLIYNHPKWTLEDLAGIKTNTLIISTDKDPAVPLAVGADMEQAMPAASRVEVLGAGHNPHIEMVEEINRILLSYLR